jgi:hypothetical protein
VARSLAASCRAGERVTRTLEDEPAETGTRIEHFAPWYQRGSHRGATKSMKNDSNTPDRAGQPERNNFRMKWLLPRAERRIARLLPDDRARVVQSLIEGTDATQCEPIATSRLPGVFHYKVGRDIRVCFAMQQGFGVVVFVGNHHECDVAVYHTKWRITGRFIPIEDSIIMRNEKKDPLNNNGAPSGSSPATPAKPSATSFAGWMQMLPAVVDASFAAPLRHTEDACLSEIEDVTARVELVSTDLATFMARLEALSQGLQSHSRETNTSLATLSTAVSATDQRANSFRHECLTSVGGLKGDLKALKGEVAGLCSDASKQFESIQSDLGGLRESHDGLKSSMTTVLGRFESFQAAAEKSDDETKTRLAVLESQDPAGPLVARLDTQDERLDRQEQIAQSTLADFAHSIDRIASLTADMGQLKEIVLAHVQGMSDLEMTVKALSDRSDSAARREVEREERRLGVRASRFLKRVQSAIRHGWNRLTDGMKRSLARPGSYSSLQRPK